MKKNPKIFHGLVNYGTQSGLFARQLRQEGLEAISVTHPDKFKRITDVELLHGGNTIQKIAKHSWNYLFRVYCFFKYDIFHFYYGITLLPKQADLPFYRLLGKKVVMEYLGNELQGYQESVRKYKWTNVTYMMTPEEGVVYDQMNLKRLAHEKPYIDKALVCAPCYSEFAPDAAVLPLAIDLRDYEYTPMPAFNGTFRIMHAPTHKGFKGTAFIEKAVRQLQAEGFSIDFDLVENVTHAELKERYKQCHLFIDQILGGWYGTASIEAMALGRPVMVFIREEYLSYIDYGDKVPVYSADPDTIYDVLKSVLTAGYDELEKRSHMSRRFTEEVHDVTVLTRQLIQLYQSLSCAA